MRVVKAVRDVGVFRGATGPHVMECDDGSTYLVKFSDGTRTAVNEHVGQTLARAVGLPTPRSAIVEISSEVIAHSADLKNRAVSPGPHQGSELVPNSADLSELIGRRDALDEDLLNWEVLPGTICLDNWILTEDRDRPENHLVQAMPGGFRYHMVDFSHSFTGLKWTADSLDQGSFERVLMPVLPQIASTVRGISSLEGCLGRIEGVTDQQIEEAASSIPRAWNVTDDERSTLVRFLETRRGLLRSVLVSNHGSFPNWTG
jgi:hypothetical protein